MPRRMPARRLARRPAGRTLGAGPRVGPPPQAWPLPAAGDPWARPRLTAPAAGEEQDLQQQKRLGFEHRPYGEGDPKVDSWSEKMNVWSTRVIANDQRERGLHWEAAQEGNLWRASLHVLPRPEQLREAWEVRVTYVHGRLRSHRARCQGGRLPLLAAGAAAGG